MIKFHVYENNNLIGNVEADSFQSAFKQWVQFAGPGKYQLLIAPSQK